MDEPDSTAKKAVTTLEKFRSDVGGLTIYLPYAAIDVKTNEFGMNQ
jgi:hypothetical protein